MDMTIHQQVALDEALVPHTSRLRIRKSNFRLRSDITSKESTLQLATATVHHYSIHFKMDNKKRIVNLEYFREMMHIFLRIPGQTFDDLPFKEEILAFLNFLGTGLYHKKNVDFAYLLWEDFVYQVDHKDAKKSNEMYYPMFTKVIIHYFMTMDPSIPRRNKVNWHYVRDDQMFTMIKLVLRHQNTQQFSAMLRIELTNEDIRNSKAYKEYYAVTAGAAPPKTKASVRKTKSSSNNTVSPPTAVVGTRLSTSAKGKQPAKASKVKNEGTGIIPGVPDVPTKEFDEEISWKSNDEEDDDDVDEGSDDQDDDDDDQDEGDDDDDDQDEGNDDDQDSGEEGEEFIHPKLSIHDEKETKDEESFDSIAKTPKNSDDEGNDDENLGMNVGREEGQDEKDDEDELYRDVNINLLRDEAQAKNEEFLKNLDENIQKIIKEQFKEQVKVQVFKILQKIEKTMNEQLEAEVLTLSSNSSKTSYAVAVDLSEMELKKILIEKIEGNKSIHRSDEQKNLYKALVEAYESDKIILDTYGDIVTLKRRRDDDADKDEEPSAGSDRGVQEAKRMKGARFNKRQRRKRPGQLASLHKGPNLNKRLQASVADDQPITEASQHPEWFQQQKKLLTPDRDWNKTLPASHGSVQPWISELANQADSRSSFNELMSTHVDFSAFLMNRLKVDTLTLELLAGPTYELMKGSCKSRRVIPFDHFINNDLEYLRGGASSRKYTTSVTKTKAADYGHIKWIEDLVPRIMWSQEPVIYNKHALWGIYHWGRKRQQFYGFAVNSESAQDVYSKRRIIAVTKLQIVEWHNYKHLDWITVRRDNDKLQKFKEGEFKRLCIQDIEDMLLLLKFSDGTLNDVRTALDDHLKGIRMKYLP
uniref:Uncharacterized protein n=1 Tax=Tanacetum cinerariifolium TaxID=118510 RepID=A0A6L2MTJ0_TANCI|nr:hypothetical protein [Tanacetum cinerariifolium]